MRSVGNTVYELISFATFKHVFVAVWYETVMKFAFCYELLLLPYSIMYMNKLFKNPLQANSIHLALSG